MIGANLGSGLLAMLNNSAANAAARRVALGSLLFKLVGSLIILPFVHLLAETMGKLSLPKAELVIYFHVFYNLVRCLVMLPFVDPMARFCKTIIRDEPELDTQLRPKHLDVSALDTPTLALANAARETLRIGDAMEQMMEGLNKVMHGEPRQEKELRKLADDINVLYTAIKLYLARMPKKSWRRKSRAAGQRSSKCRSTLNRPPISSSAWAAKLLTNHWQHGGHFRLMG